MINEFEFIKEQYNIPAEILNKIENDIAGDKKNNIHLTALQKQAIGDSEFWCNDGENPNIVIQGATSSGKTLVAELLALQYVFAKNKHVVYLVPLKALVSEKVAQFKKDILNINENMKINIFASSSDYQDHDTELAEGQYDIAVVVYEKFFAMLAEQKDNKFLKKCGLIIVDEIQLLGSQDRGAKLEYAITKVNNNYSGKVRILGLTTVDCDVSYVTNWLNAKVISNPCRPIGLKEKIISLNGNYWEREVPGENANTTSILEDEHNEGRLLIEDIERMRNQKIDTKKNMLLFALLRDIYNRDPDKKIIVFASSRMRCRKIASEIAGSNVLEKQQVNISLNNELEKADDESEKNLFQNQLLPFGVAYHSAALPMSLRELIEYEFKKSDGSIKLIVATETLTIGMNLPADVMILYDNQVFRGNGEGAVDIRPQEYKNYIGRAGRLGITDKVGESYLFVNADTDIPFYWNKYVKCKIENISSALIKADERECAPYYLNLLCKGKEEKFTEKTIEELAHKTLKASEKELKGEILTLDTSKIIKDFKKVNLIDENKDDEDELDDEYEDDKEYYKYKLSKFGETLAPYALSVKTCFLIKKYFIDSEYKSKSGKKGNLPVVYTDNDLSENKYILDIIYTICKMNEVKKLSHPRLPDPVNPRARMIYQSMKRAIFNYLKQYKGTYGENAFWENSELEQIGIDIDSVDDDQVNNALRAILLFHWIKGELPSKIKENTGLKNTDFVLYTGDMARIGESCSYIVEAISKCFFLNNERMNGRLGALEHAFYSLSVKMKYGLANPNLIQVANRHVYGLTRSTIIKMDEDARNNGFDNINLFIRSNNEKVFKHLTRTQRKELIQQMSERYDDKNIENLISKVIEDEIVDFMMRSDFERIAKSKKQAECLDSLRNIFSALEGTQVIEIRMSNIKGYKLKWSNQMLYVLDGTNNLSKDLSNEYRDILKLDYQQKILFVICHELEDVQLNDNDIVVTSELLCKIILEFLALSGRTSGISICNYLISCNDVIVDKGISSLQHSISNLLALEYDSDTENQDTADASELLYPYDQYIKKYNYTHLKDIDKDQGRASVHMVKGGHGIGKYAVKEINVPENNDEYNVLNEQSQKLCEILINAFGKENYNKEDIIREIYKNNLDGGINEEDLEKIVKLAFKREKQLDSSIKNKDFYFCQSIVFGLAGYLKLKEARISYDMANRNSHIVNIFNPDIIQYDYQHLELNDIDTKFNKLRSVIFFAMDLYEGSLADIKNKLYNNCEEIKKIGIQICDALEFCHEKKIIHRDIKPENILYQDSNYYLCDFGCATRKSDGKTMGVGTERFRAPEAMEGRYTERSDIFSLGKTLLWLYTKKSQSQDFNKDSDESDAMTKVLLEACDNNEEYRFQNANEFRDALMAISSNNMK